MAKSKKKSSDPTAPRDYTEVAEEKERTSNDGRFSTYERVQVPGGELILQHRGEPDKSPRDA